MTSDRNNTDSLIAASIPVAEALEYLKPVEVKRAEEKGLKTVRQGDWYFVPVARHITGEVVTFLSLDDDHVADQAIHLRTVIYVRGWIKHDEHKSVLLTAWHKAIRNKALRRRGIED